MKRCEAWLVEFGRGGARRLRRRMRNVVGWHVIFLGGAWDSAVGLGVGCEEVMGAQRPA